MLADSMINARAVLPTVRATARNALALVPGERPAWIVVELTGTLTPRPERARLFGLPVPARGLVPERPSLDALVATLEALGRAPWLTGVLFRVEGFHADLATAYALRRAIVALAGAGKRTVAYLTQLDWTGYYVASAAAEVVAPESAEHRAPRASACPSHLHARRAGAGGRALSRSWPSTSTRTPSTTWSGRR